MYISSSYSFSAKAISVAWIRSAADVLVDAPGSRREKPVASSLGLVKHICLYFYRFSWTSSFVRRCKVLGEVLLGMRNHGYRPTIYRLSTWKRRRRRRQKSRKRASLWYCDPIKSSFLRSRLATCEASFQMSLNFTLPLVAPPPPPPAPLFHILSEYGTWLNMKFKSHSPRSRFDFPKE